MCPYCVGLAVLLDERLLLGFDSTVSSDTELTVSPSRGGHGPSGPTGVILRSRGVNEVFTPLKVRSQVQS